MRNLLCLIFVVVLLRPGYGSPLHLSGMDKTTVVQDAAPLMPDLHSDRLPGHAVGVLFWDPEHERRVIFSIRGKTWSNLFVADPADARPQSYPIDHQGGKLDLPTGVRIATLQDLGLKTLPVLADVEVNQGKGVEGINGFMVGAVRPVAPAVFALPADRVAQSCQADFKKVAPHYVHEVQAPLQDLLYATYDETSRSLVVTLLRRVPSQVINTRKLPHPYQRTAPRNLLVARYRVDPKGKVQKDVALIH